MLSTAGRGLTRPTRNRLNKELNKEPFLTRLNKEPTLTRNSLLRLQLLNKEFLVKLGLTRDFLVEPFLSQNAEKHAMDGQIHW